MKADFSLRQQEDGKRNQDLGHEEDGLEVGGQPKTSGWMQRNGGPGSDLAAGDTGWTQRYLESESGSPGGLTGLRAREYSARAEMEAVQPLPQAGAWGRLAMVTAWK